MKYNQKKQGEPAITTHEGGIAFEQSPEVALLSLLATGLDKTFYEKSDERQSRLVKLVEEVAQKDPYFAAQCIVYARVVMDQRTSTHLAAAALAKFAAGTEWGRHFYGRWDKKKGQGGIVVRLDDALEISSAYFHLNPDTQTKRGHKSITNAMKKGFSVVLSLADRYELGKYSGRRRTLSLIDLVRLCHPKRTPLIEELVKEGRIKAHDTAESKNSEAGQIVREKVESGEITEEQAEEALQELKGLNYDELITSGKIGYIQLIRNLVQIVKADPELTDKACKLITNKDRIKGSHIFPHQIDIANEIIQMDLTSVHNHKLVAALNEAYEIATEHVKDLGIDEYTAVVIDTSASMNANGLIKMDKRNINKKPIEKAALIGATLAKGVLADVYEFASTAATLQYNPTDSVGTIKNRFAVTDSKCGHGTELDQVFKLFNELGKVYKRVFIISDLQIYDSMVVHTSEYKKFVDRCGEPYIYAIDLVGYGNQPLKQSNRRYFNIAGYSSHIYETAKRYEIDPQALISEVKQIKIIP